MLVDVVVCAGVVLVAVAVVDLVMVVVIDIVVAAVIVDAVCFHLKISVVVKPTTSKIHAGDCGSPPPSPSPDVHAMTT